MSRLSSYVLRLLVGPIVMLTLLLAGVILMTQSLNLLNVVINGGQSASTFLYMALLLLPSLLVIILPIAFFFGTLLTLSRLNSDSELVVMSAAGFSRQQLAGPVFAAGAFVILLTYLCAIYLMPLGLRTLSDVMVDIRGDVGASLLNEGEFNTPAKGLTVFIREVNSGGDIRGVLVHNNTNQETPVTYLAERGLLARTPDGARLVMFDGTVEWGRGPDMKVLTFKSYNLDLDQFSSATRSIFRRPKELYLSELLSPSNPDSVRNSYLAEAHDRLSQPLYSIAFALIGLAAVTRGRRGRGASAIRLTAGSLSAVGLRVAGYGAAGLAARQTWFMPALYVIPLIGAIIANAFFNGFDPLRYFRRPAAREMTS